MATEPEGTATADGEPVEMTEEEKEAAKAAAKEARKAAAKAAKKAKKEAEEAAAAALEEARKDPFIKFDMEQVGYIDEKRLQTALHALYPTSVVTKDYAGALLLKFDDDHDSVLNRDEFKSLLAYVADNKPPPRPRYR